MKRLTLLLSPNSIRTALLICLALLLRLPLLNGSFWLDEAAQALESIRPLSQQLSIARDFQPPLLHLLIHFASYFSYTEWWLRTVGALIPGLFTILFFYKSTQKVFSEKTALVSTLLVITSSFHIFYSQELRPYSLAAVWASLSWFLIISNTFKPKNSQGFTKKSLVLYCLATTLGMYSTYLYPFVVLSQVIYVAFQEKKQLMKVVISLLISALLFIPWLPYLWEQLQVGQSLRRELPGWEAVVSIPQLKSLPLTFGKFMFGVLNIEINGWYLVVTASIIGLFGFLVWQKKRNFFLSKKMILIYCWLLVPLAAAWIFSFWVPILQPKRVLYLLPAWFLLLSVVAFEDTIEDKKSRQIKTAQVLLCVVLFMCNIFSTLQYYANPLYQRENWRDLRATILQRYPDDSTIIFGFSEPFSPWVWYDQGRYPVLTTGIYTPIDTKPATGKLNKASEYSYVLVFDYLRDLTDPGHTIEIELHNLGYTEKDVFSAPNIGFVRVFARQEAVLSLRRN